ncbi:MAG: hypothetical protein AB7P17_10075 [Nitrospirales bacterium]|nr:hypothetical protein [Nitrospirales bacterium]
MEMLSRVKHEAKEVGLVTLYFFFCFGIILILKKLMLASYEIEFYALSSAVVSALIVGKVVVVLDTTRAGTKLDASHSLGVAALYKTMVYSGFTFLVLSAEKIFHAYRESHTMGEAIMNVWTHHDRNIMLAKVICIGVAFMGYHLYRGIDRRLGKGTLKRIIFNAP